MDKCRKKHKRLKRASEALEKNSFYTAEYNTFRRMIEARGGVVKMSYNEFVKAHRKAAKETLLDAINLAYLASCYTLATRYRFGVKKLPQYMLENKRLLDAIGNNERSIEDFNDELKCEGTDVAASFGTYTYKNGHYASTLKEHLHRDAFDQLKNTLVLPAYTLYFRYGWNAQKLNDFMRNVITDLKAIENDIKSIITIVAKKDVDFFEDFEEWT